MRPGLKDAVKCILRTGSAHNRGGGSFRCKHCLNFTNVKVESVNNAFVCIMVFTVSLKSGIFWAAKSLI